jgi:cobalt-zinc-cadmium efflux system membrane fusion protein
MKKYLLPLAMVAAMLNGCVQPHLHENETGKEGLEPVTFTLYTDKTELFVEFKPLVVGEESRFAAHLTHLGEAFTPFTDATITLTLTVNGEKLITNESDAVAEGIYILGLTPEMAGDATLTFDVEEEGQKDQLVIKNLKAYADEATAETDAPEGDALGEHTYLKDQAWKVEFAHEVVKKQPFRDVLKTSGQLLSAPGDEMVVVAKASGLVRLAGSSVVGSRVNESAPMFVISGGDMADGNVDAAYLEGKSNYEKAKADHDRSKELIKDKIISEQAFSETQVVFENAQTAFNTLAKNHSAKGQTVLSPMSGFIKQLLVTEGAYVEAGTPLTTISKNEKLILQANVSQKYFSRLPSVVSANFKHAGSDEVINTNELNGKVISYGRSASAHAPFIPILFEIENKGGLIPGSVVEVYLRSNEIANALVIPTGALMEEQGKFYVFVQVSGESFDKRELTLGANDGDQVQVLSGLKEGERVVTKGAYNIKLSLASGTLPAHGHEH